MFCFKKLKVNKSIQEYSKSKDIDNDESDKNQEREVLIYNANDLAGNVSFQSGGGSSSITFSPSSNISPLSNFSRVLSFSSPQIIDRSHECLERVPNDLLRTANVQLKELNLSSNFLKALPGHFYRLSRLIHLDLSDNQIVRLSSEIELLSNLEFLDISRKLYIDYLRRKLICLIFSFHFSQSHSFQTLSLFFMSNLCLMLTVNIMTHQKPFDKCP